MDNLVNKQLVFDHFAGRITALQRRMIEEWLQQPANVDRYYEWLEEWENGNPQYAVAVEKALELSIQHLVTEFTPSPRAEPVEPNRFLSAWRWAAMLAGLLLLSSLYVGRSYILYRSAETGYGELRKVLLPEGSTVTLNANSSLRYSRFGFGGQTRRVWLTGEASFDVRHLRSHTPFVVSTNHQFDVIVLGTEFSVFSRPRGANVVLRRGKVEVVHTENRVAQRLTLKPGDLVSLDEKGLLSMRHLTRPEVYTAWQEHRFEFDQTPLSEIAQMLEESYGVPVTIADSALGQRTVSGTFSARTATELSQVIADLLDVNVDHKNNRILFANLANP